MVPQASCLVVCEDCRQVRFEKTLDLSNLQHNEVCPWSAVGSWHALFKICLCPIQDHLSGTWAPCQLLEYSRVWLNKLFMKETYFLFYSRGLQNSYSSNLIDTVPLDVKGALQLHYERLCWKQNKKRTRGKVFLANRNVWKGNNSQSWMLPCSANPKSIIMLCLTSHL